MLYTDFCNKIGCKYSIINGNLVETEDGLLTVSHAFADYTIYLNKLNKTVDIVTPYNSFIGRKYKFRYMDCITLVTDWLVYNGYSTNLVDFYKNLSHREFYKYYTAGLKLWFVDYNYIEVESLDSANIGDILIYSYDSIINVHLGILLENNKILHHLPGKLSSIDDIDTSKILGIYRCPL